MIQTNIYTSVYLYEQRRVLQISNQLKQNWMESKAKQERKKTQKFANHQLMWRPIFGFLEIYDRLKWKGFGRNQNNR